MPLKQMVKSTDVEIAKARRTCRYSKEAITKGSVCMVVYDGPRDRSCYSKKIALEMIQLARKRLDALEAELTKGPDHRDTPDNSGHISAISTAILSRTGD